MIFEKHIKKNILDITYDRFLTKTHSVLIVMVTLMVSVTLAFIGVFITLVSTNKIEFNLDKVLFLLFIIVIYNAPIFLIGVKKIEDWREIRDNILRKMKQLGD